MLSPVKCACATSPGQQPARRNRAAYLCLAALQWIALVHATCAKAEGAAAVGATSSRAARASALRAMPLDKVDPELRQKIAVVVNKPTVFRRLPIEVIECDPKLYLFLIKNPEVVVNIWEVMGISKVTLRRTGPKMFAASDGTGTRGNLVYGYSDHDTQLIYAEGSYEGPLFSRPLKAQCVLLLKSAYIRETNDRYYVTNRLDAFIHIENAGIDLLAKSFQPLVTKSADINFTETAAFVSTVSRTAEANTRGMVRLANKLKRVEPELRQEFAELSLEVGRNATQRRRSELAARDSGEDEKAATTRQR